MYYLDLASDCYRPTCASTFIEIMDFQGYKMMQRLDRNNGPKYQW